MSTTDANPGPVDRLARPLRSLRLSVTDRCNLRCEYCMPEDEYVWLPREDILGFEELDRLTRLFAAEGVSRVRLTGGEPLLRRDLPELVRRLAAIDGVTDLALTTNGVLLASHAAALAGAGLGRVTVSLDTLRRERFQRLARLDALPETLRGIEAARTHFEIVKLDSVIIRDVNDDELIDLLEFGRSAGVEVRFIEYMDVGGATRWSPARVVSRAEMLAAIEQRYGPVAPVDESSWAPADRYRTADGLIFGIIASTTQPFCRTCDRSRVTADGLWYLCLYAREGHDLRALLRSGGADDEIRGVIRETWQLRTDRGAELRASERERMPFVPVSRLRRDPHLEMHTRGG